MRRIPAQTRAAAPAAPQLVQRVRPRARQHQGDDAARQQRAGVPGGGAGGRRAHARRGRRRARGSAAVLCGGHAGDAAVGDWGEWGREVC